MTDLHVRRSDSYDFVVCGGGPAGFSAAINAARKGLKVALVEAQGCLGGVSTSGGIHYLLAGRKLNDQTREHVRVIGGLFDEITDRLIQEGHAIEPNTINLDFNPVGWYPRMASGIVFDENAMKVLMDSVCAEWGVRVYLNTTVVAVGLNHRQIKSVIVHNKDGFVELTASCFADCTGDADVAAMSGCSYDIGREEDGLTAPASVEMHVDHVDGDALVTYQNEHQSPKLVEIIEELKEKGIWKFPYEIFVCMQLMEKDVFLINTIRQVAVDGTSEASISKAMAHGRKESQELFNIMKAYFPGFSNARIRKICDWIGIRESRRIRGRETITLEAALKGKKYPNRISATTYNFDLPDPLRPSYDPMMGDAKRPNASRRHIVIQIPYGSLLPREIDNLIVAGRCVSAEREVLGAVRIMAPSVQMGQAAGTAAALAFTHHGGIFADVNISQLQDTLWADGVLDPETLPFD
jgi:hypothetical protein